MSLAVITPTIGSKYLKKCIESINSQTNKNFTYYIVIDGSKYKEDVYNILKDIELPENLKIIPLDENTGANGWNGHRIYIAMSFLINTEYIMFLDEDNFLEATHVESILEIVKEKRIDWTFALRNIVDKDDKFICQDKCESLGYLHHVWNNPNDHLVDVNCYCIKTEIFRKHCLEFYKKARPVNDDEVDRALFKKLVQYKCVSTRRYTVNYRVGNRLDSVKAEFFIEGNKRISINLKENLYIFHLNQDWTEKCLITNKLDYESLKYLYEDGNKAMLYPLKEKFNLINGYTNPIPANSTCFITLMDFRVLPDFIIKRKDLHIIVYLLEGPNSWHKYNYDYNVLKYFDKIITYCDSIIKLPNVEYFPFVSRFDKIHLKYLQKNRRYDKSIGMILANRQNNEIYEINGVKLQRLDYLRKKFAIFLDNLTVRGSGWDEIEHHKYIKVENIPNRMVDNTNIFDFYKKFNFALIVENCDAENYVSEKIYDAWIAGCIPIYYGNNDKIDLPRDCYIDIKDFNNIEQVNSYINKMEKKHIDVYYDNINEQIISILEKVSPEKLCEKIISMI